MIRLGGKYGLRFIIVLDAYVAADYPIKGEAWFHSGYKGCSDPSRREWTA